MGCCAMLEIPATVWMVTKVVQSSAMLKPASVQVIMEIDGLVFRKTRALVITSNGSFLLIHDPSSVTALMTSCEILKELVSLQANIKQQCWITLL
ncbi:hypothetical protein ACLKA7_002304 [Drosophila subpalustris]